MTPILPITTVIFLGLFAKGLMLAVLPGRIHLGLGFDAVTVGWVMGVQSVVTLMTRPWAGRLADRRGGKHAVSIGLFTLAGCGGLYAVSAVPGVSPAGQLAILVAGRLLAGLGDGLVATGGGGWAINRAGSDFIGRAMSWVGLAMFAGLAAGVAAGATLDGAQGFLAVAGLAAAIPLVTAFAIGRGGSPRAEAINRPIPFRRVVAQMWCPGLTLALSAGGYAAVASFLMLAYAARGWQGGGIALAAFGAGHVAARLACGGLADRTRGPGGAVVTLLIEAAGLCLLWSAPSPELALAGSAITGFGFSMVYPLLAMPALRAVPAINRGAAIGVYDAFFDIAMGTSTLACGVAAGMFGAPAAFLFAALAALLAAGTALASLRIR